MQERIHALLDRPPSLLAAAYMLCGVVWVPGGWLLFDAALGGPGLSLPGLVNGVTLVISTGWLLYGAATIRQRRAADVRRELETSDQQLQVLSRVLRHNIRNDLNIVHGYTNLIEARVDDERSHEYLATIRETTDDVVGISEKLRMIEEVNDGPPDGRVDLVRITRQAVSEIKQDADGVEIDVDLPASAWIRADESCSYAIEEVLENAVAHNDEPVCRIRITVERDATRTLLVVQDNGPGIPADELAVLESAEETPLSHASSIGLWLVKWLCELQHGDVTFDTNGDGTRVTLQFRSVSAPPDADGSPTSDSTVGGSKEASGSRGESDVDDSGESDSGGGDEKRCEPTGSR